MKPLVFEGEVKLGAVDNKSMESDDIVCTTDEQTTLFFYSWTSEEGPAVEAHPTLMPLANKRVRVTVEVIE